MKSLMVGRATATRGSRIGRRLLTVGSSPLWQSFCRMLRRRNLRHRQRLQPSSRRHLPQHWWQRMLLGPAQRPDGIRQQRHRQQLLVRSGCGDHPFFGCRFPYSGLWNLVLVAEHWPRGHLVRRRRICDRNRHRSRHLQRPGGSYCYWEQDSDFLGTDNSIISNDMPSGPVTVQLAANAVRFVGQGCGTWTKS